MTAAPDISKALGLGMLQGVTEFLPVSSSGHLAAFAMVVDVPESSLTLTVLLHASTLLATVLVFFPDLVALTSSTFRGLRNPRAYLRTEQGQLFRNIVLACIPTGLIGLTMEERVEVLSNRAWVVGVCFLLSAAAVLATRGRAGGAERCSAGTALLIGLVQGLAVLPGLSRSGSTIACAMLLGLSAPAAFRFSFLVSIPVIAGATALALGKPGALSQMTATAWLAAAITFIAGYASLRLLRGVLRRGHLWLFAWYLVPLGSAMILSDLV